MVKAHSTCAQTECNVRVNVRSICLWTKCWSDYGGHKVHQQLRTFSVLKSRTGFTPLYANALSYALRGWRLTRVVSACACPRLA